MNTDRTEHEGSFLGSVVACQLAVMVGIALDTTAVRGVNEIVGQVVGVITDNAVGEENQQVTNAPGA